MKVYIAAPLFNFGERQFMNRSTRSFGPAVMKRFSHSGKAAVSRICRTR